MLTQQMETPMTQWSDFNIIKEASKYATRSEFRTAFPYAYSIALHSGLLPYLYPFSTTRLGKAVAMAKQINNAAEFRKQYPAMARMLHRYGYRNDGVQYEQCRFGCRGSCKGLGKCERYARN
jgi:hypothetical protein